MKAQVIKIGNSRGIRLPKSVIKECEFDKEVEIKISQKKLIITKSKSPRYDWDTIFKELTENGNNAEKLIMPEVINEFDKEEWEW